jgi:GNAT superfamily N-acetyltransferase
VNRTQVPLTAIRRASAADLTALSDFFAGLSVQTRYRRFFAAVTPTPAMLRTLSGGTGTVDAVIAVRDGVIIGHAMAADLASPADLSSPADRARAADRAMAGATMTEIGVVVADAWQGQGVGSALTSTLIAAAQARGVTDVAMAVLPSNQQVLAMIARRWPAARTGHGADFATVRVRLPRPPRPRRPCCADVALAGAALQYVHGWRGVPARAR